MKTREKFANKDNHNIYIKMILLSFYAAFSEAPWRIQLDFYALGEKTSTDAFPGN